MSEAVDYKFTKLTILTDSATVYTWVSKILDSRRPFLREDFQGSQQHINAIWGFGNTAGHIEKLIFEKQILE